MTRNETSGSGFAAINQLGLGVYAGWESLMSWRSIDFSAVRSGTWRDIRSYTVQCGYTSRVPEHGNQGSVQVWQTMVSSVSERGHLIQLKCSSSSYRILAQQCRVLSLVIGRFPVSFFFPRKVWVLSRNLGLLNQDISSRWLHSHFSTWMIPQKSAPRHKFVCAHLSSNAPITFLNQYRFIKIWNS